MSGYPFIDSPAGHSGLWLKKTSFVYSLDPESPITGVMAAKASEIPPIIPGDLLTSSYIHARLSSCFSLVLPLWKGISIWINQNPAQPRPGTAKTRHNRPHHHSFASRETTRWMPGFKTGLRNSSFLTDAATLHQIILGPFWVGHLSEQICYDLFTNNFIGQ